MDGILAPQQVKIERMLVAASKGLQVKLENCEDVESICDSAKAKGFRVPSLHFRKTRQTREERGAAQRLLGHIGRGAPHTNGDTRHGGAMSRSAAAP